jgi:hypothetical protein
MGDWEMGQFSDGPIGVLVVSGWAGRPAYLGYD